jgi:hypothetical protein
VNGRGVIEKENQQGIVPEDHKSPKRKPVLITSSGRRSQDHVVLLTLLSPIPSSSQMQTME